MLKDPRVQWPRHKPINKKLPHLIIIRRLFFRDMVPLSENYTLKVSQKFLSFAAAQEKDIAEDRRWTDNRLSGKREREDFGRNVEKPPKFKLPIILILLPSLTTKVCPIMKRSSICFARAWAEPSDPRSKRKLGNSYLS